MEEDLETLKKLADSAKTIPRECAVMAHIKKYATSWVPVPGFLSLVIRLGESFAANSGS